MAIVRIKQPDGAWADMPALVGPPGQEGPQGEQGKQGIQGIRGLQGVGVSSVEIEEVQ